MIKGCHIMGIITDIISKIALISSNPFLTGISTLLSILGFFVSLSILILANMYKRKLFLFSEIKDFNRDREYHADRLQGFIDLIIKNKIMDLRLLSDLAIEARTFESYDRVLTNKEKKIAKKLVQLLENDIDLINKNILCNYIAYIISRYKRDREGLII